MRRLHVLPRMQCDSGCGQCCGVVPVTEEELSHVKAFAIHRAIQPVEEAIAAIVRYLLQTGRAPRLSCDNDMVLVEAELVVSPNMDVTVSWKDRRAP